MIKSHRLLLCLCFSWIFAFQVFAEAPVVDDSENFAILDDQQAAIEQPVAKAQLDDIDNEEEIALAQDNSDSNNANAGLLDKLHGLQQELQELRGQLEVQAHDLKLLQQQQLAFYKDLDARLRNTNPGKSAQALPLTKEDKPTELSLGLSETQAPTSTETPTKPKTQTDNLVAAPLNSTSRGNPADEQISYMAAYDLVKGKRFDEALTAMQRFVVQYPQGGYTANAQYWLGELYLVKNNYTKAIEHFEIVLKKFPSSSKAAASTLKIGYALAASGKIEDARMRLQEVLRNYPDTPTAQLAATKLETLGVS
ncbi:tol-pal system protein YbgF [Legionella jamestowniensis]|uniref:Cell division coordinator CpoB n=1 Tax=Legionella jamestowniensis TaxID=455 RepID=A0A0W0UZC4_9GAMM|nr:tol-pal system protein YbgF [Legionella jamestowniensis]KTD12966.1 outer membrane protein [Legionella jamestowniensis]OCH98247.1 tol-pal system protein YbgF [Legionella jamestowniensis]SFL78792.1 tol-pal system protein YbgF [Legionella jamestowniensis DSM 19215]